MAEETKSLQDLGSLTGQAGSPAVTGAGSTETKPVHVQKLDKYGRAYATGKRKNAVARVWIKQIGRAHV